MNIYVVSWNTQGGGQEKEDFIINMIIPKYNPAIIMLQDIGEMRAKSFEEGLKALGYYCAIESVLPSEEDGIPKGSVQKYSRKEFFVLTAVKSEILSCTSQEIIHYKSSLVNLITTGEPGYDGVSVRRPLKLKCDFVSGNKLYELSIYNVYNSYHARHQKTSLLEIQQSLDHIFTTDVVDRILIAGDFNTDILKVNDNYSFGQNKLDYFIIKGLVPSYDFNLENGGSDHEMLIFQIDLA